jgi:hypothetical protein
MRYLQLGLLLLILGCTKNETKEDKFVIELISIFDSIYEVNSNDNYFRLKTNHLDELKHKYSSTTFFLSGAKRHFQYGNLEIIELSNNKQSSIVFKKILQNLRDENKHKNINKYFEIFPKSGIFYILKDKYIISKKRRCNDDWKNNEHLEQLFLSKLFPKTPNENHFIRVCCSCPLNKMVEIK